MPKATSKTETDIDQLPSSASPCPRPPAQPKKSRQRRGRQRTEKRLLYARALAVANAVNDRYPRLYKKRASTLFSLLAQSKYSQGLWAPLPTSPSPNGPPSISRQFFRVPRYPLPSAVITTNGQTNSPAEQLLTPFKSFGKPDTISFKGVVEVPADSNQCSHVRQIFSSFEALDWTCV